MAVIGHGVRGLIAARTLPFAAAAFFVALFSSAWAWPFAIDDAWISVRYARHLACGAGYVWNVGAHATDGVTPLPWAPLLALFAKAPPVIVLGRAKLLGACVWTVAATAWGTAVGRARAPSWAKWMAIVLLALDVPVAAHAVSGMETALALALATFAVLCPEKPRCAAAFAGIAAAFRPELVVWALAVTLGFDALKHSRPARRIASTAFAVLPFAVCAGVRVVVFGRPAPLSLWAKPSDFAHGLSYAGAAAIFTLAPLALFSPLALFRERGPAFVLALAAAVHFAVIISVGGDWMPYARLAAPIVPSMLLAFALVAPYTRPRSTVARWVVALGVAVWLDPKNARALRASGHDRARMIEDAAVLLRGAKRIAAVDIGWVSAVCEAPIIDLAGVTDPEVAVLPGGHTSKRIDASFLVARGADVVLFYASRLPSPLAGAAPELFSRVVETRLASAPFFAQKFEPAAFLPLGNEGAGYVLYRRRVESGD